MIVTFAFENLECQLPHGVQVVSNSGCIGEGEDERAEHEDLFLGRCRGEAEETGFDEARGVLSED